MDLNLFNSIQIIKQVNKSQLYKKFVNGFYL